MLRPLRLVVAPCVLFLQAASPADAQRLDARVLDQGFKVTAEADATGKERSRQPDLYMLRTDLKPLRMRTLKVTNPATGQVSEEQILYLVYRAQNLPLRQAETTRDQRPENTLDKPYTNPRFIPEVSIASYFGPSETGTPDQELMDVVLPEAVTQLARIERRKGTPEIPDSVGVIRPLPDAVEDSEPIYGIATFRGLDTRADYIVVFLRGFTNAYDVREEDDGSRRVYRKVLVQKFSRRGDEFRPDQREFEFDGPPEWRYLPAEPYVAQ